jgi:hypothetical protein
MNGRWRKRACWKFRWHGRGSSGCNNRSATERTLYRCRNTKINPCPRKRKPTIPPDDVLPVRNEEGFAPMGSSTRRTGGEGLEGKGKRLHF